MPITNDLAALPKEVIINFSVPSSMFLGQALAGEICHPALDHGTPFTHALSVGARMGFFGRCCINYSREKR
jgi:hypothetical protein